MADGASTSSRLSKLARLKNLKSGMSANAGESKAVAPEPVVEQPKPKPTEQDVKDSETLSAYFEALGIVPDGGQPSPPKAKIDPAEKPKPEQAGRDVEAGDLWYDPVRNDDAYIASFQGKADDDNEDDLSLDSIIGDFAGEEDEAVELESVIDDATAIAMPEAESDTDTETNTDTDLTAAPENDTHTGDDSEIKIEPMPDFEPEAADEPFTLPDMQDGETTEEPIEEFDMPIDIEAFEAQAAATGSQANTTETQLPEPELEIDFPEMESTPDQTPPVAEVTNTDGATDQPLTITFDEGRATLLQHVSKQMNCSIDDVVVTAIDWYLDALFGEDDPDLASEADASA